MSGNDTGHGMLGPTSQHANGEDFTDARGRRWVASEKVMTNDIAVAEDRRERRNSDHEAPAGPAIHTMSLDELAEKLRPRRLVGDFEYRLEEPDYAVAELILAMKEVPRTDCWPGNASASMSLKYLIGDGDNDRHRFDSPQHFPASATARLLPQRATATMIGPSTALSAAHCFYKNGWIPSSSTTFGADTKPPEAPFGSFLADSLTMPGAWTGSQPDWDFAVLEFSPSRPDIGRQTGWFGTAENFHGWKTMIGYPKDKNGQPWIKGGTFTAAPGARYEHNIDALDGDSGAGAYHNDDFRCNGIQTTEHMTSNPFRVWNEVRRWDATTHNFFAAYGNWPRG